MTKEGQLAEQDVNKFTQLWIRKNCLLPIDALYGMCIEFSEDLSKFLAKNEQFHKVWGLWSLFDTNISNQLPLIYDTSTNILDELLKTSEYDLSDIGYENHVVIEWNGGFWDVNGKQTPEQIKSNFDIDNKNMHFFLLDYL